jgi:putative endonuclease
VYIVRCVDGTYYTGWSTNVTRRVAAHNAGRGGRYTRTHRPVTLVYQEEVPDRKTAMQREMAIKQYTRARKEQLIGGGPVERPATS